MQATNKRSNDLTLLAGSIVVAVIGGAVIHTILFQKKNDEKRMPYASAGMMATVRGISAKARALFSFKLGARIETL